MVKWRRGRCCRGVNGDPRQELEDDQPVLMWYEPVQVGFPDVICNLINKHTFNIFSVIKVEFCPKFVGSTPKSSKSRLSFRYVFVNKNKQCNIYSQ